MTLHDFLRDHLALALSSERRADLAGFWCLDDKVSGSDLENSVEREDSPRWW